MDDLGDFQKRILEAIPKAAKCGDGNALRVLGLIAGEMESKSRDWKARFEQLSAATEPIEVKTVKQFATGENEKKTAAETHEYTGRPIRSFTFDGEMFVVSSFAEMLVKLAGLMLRRHRERFHAVTALVQGRKPYFSDRDSELLRATEIEPGIYVETCRSHNETMKICRRLVKAFGYPPETFSVDVVPFRTRAVKRNAAGPREEPVDDMSDCE
jgi:hypothetical protein